MRLRHFLESLPANKPERKNESNSVPCLHAYLSKRKMTKNGCTLVHGIVQGLSSCQKKLYLGS